MLFETARRAPVVSMATLGAILLVAAEPYGERFRPQFHFSPQSNWTNDPCGLVFAFGNYHLFFQHNPFANVWGHMSWGHAVSPDLVHWKQEPVAIPDDGKVAIFTGSSVVDTHNTSGLCTEPGGGCIVSIYTGYSPKSVNAKERQTQNLAVSQDGITWTKYPGNPVLDLGLPDTRDPKVFWYEPTHRWIMVIVMADEKKIRIFDSANLKRWQPLSEFGPEGGSGGQWECPDLYRLAVEGQPGEFRWILKIGLNPGHMAGGSGEQYFVGDFDGKRFHNDNPPDKIHWLDYGRDCYCSLTFNGEPQTKAPSMIGWMSNWQYAGKAPTEPWRGAMTLPRSLRLAADPDGSLLLRQAPIGESPGTQAGTGITALREGTPFRYSGANISELNSRISSWPGRSQTFEMEMTLDPGSAKQFAWKLLRGAGDETVLAYDAGRGELSLDRSKNAGANFSPAFPSKTVAPLRTGKGPLKWKVFVDRSSIEVFAGEGTVAMTNLVFPKDSSDGMALEAGAGQIKHMELTVRRLRSAWKERAK